MYEQWPLACPRCYDLINDSRKSAVIDRELAKRSVDMAAIQETRHLEKGSIRVQTILVKKTSWLRTSTRRWTCCEELLMQQTRGTICNL